MVCIIWFLPSILKHGLTAVMKATANGHLDIVNKLIDSGACVDATNKVGNKLSDLCACVNETSINGLDKFNIIISKLLDLWYGCTCISMVDLSVALTDAFYFSQQVLINIMDVTFSKHFVVVNNLRIV